MPKEFDFDKLTGSDNYHRAFAARNYLIYKGYEKCLKTVVEKDVAVTVEKYADKLNSCKAVLCLCVDKSLYVHIKSCGTALDIWQKFQSMFEDKVLSRKIGLLKTLINVRLEDSDCMQSYVDKIMTCSNKLNDIGFTISDEWQSAILLAGLTELYRPLIMGIEAANIELTANSVISKLIEAQPNEKEKGKAFHVKKNQELDIKVKTVDPKKNASAKTVVSKTIWLKIAGSQKRQMVRKIRRKPNQRFWLCRAEAKHRKTGMWIQEVHNT